MNDIPQRSKRGLDLGVAAELGDLLHELTHDPKVRGEIGRVIKKARPDSPHAAAFADVEQEDRFEAFKREQDEREIKAQQKAVIDQMNAKRSALLSGDEEGRGRKYSEDDIKKIEELMQRKGITDYDDGATLYAATLPPDTPKPSDGPAKHGATWEFPEWAKFSKNHQLAARDTAFAVIDEFKRRRA
jgi:hypothetical protein